MNTNTLARYFMVLALIMILSGLVFGVLASHAYLLPDFMKSSGGFARLRPMHVSAVLFWILLGATACVYAGLSRLGRPFAPTGKLGLIQFALWIIAIIGIFYCYFTGDIGGREYWKFPPQWAIPIAIAWVLMIINYFKGIGSLKERPVYVWMWMTGVVFFLFIFLENYLWIFPYFRTHFISDMTIQWKVNGSLVGAWNQIIYGTSFFVMDRISGNKETGSSKAAFAMYFLGLFNLMFNWGHHVYTLPTSDYVRYVGYIVSMTEWIIFIKIIYTWRASLDTARKNYHYFPYRFLMASDFWVFFNLTQALLLSIPAINLYTHGTHITVAHAMGTTVGINTMILLAAFFELGGGNVRRDAHGKLLNISFWTIQVSLFVFLIALNIAGIKRGLWQMSSERMPFGEMMDTLAPVFAVFTGMGYILMLAMMVPVIYLLKNLMTGGTREQD
jgi:nitric oxide reductase subunit B